MNRRKFMALTPAFPAAAVTASLTLRKDGEPPIEGLDVSVLELQTGDTLVLRVDGYISVEQADRIKETIEHRFPGTKALILGEGMMLAGVLRAIS